MNIIYSLTSPVYLSNSQTKFVYYYYGYIQVPFPPRCPRRPIPHPCCLLRSRPCPHPPLSALLVPAIVPVVCAVLVVFFLVDALVIPVVAALEVLSKCLLAVTTLLILPPLLTDAPP